MGVSTTGASGRSLARLATAASVLTLLGGLGFYAYGPPVTPAFRAGAVAECNRLTGGSYRSYQLDWVLSVRPHWACTDRTTPREPPADMGWWVEPRLWGRL